jgi:hypothetical protein
MIEMNDLNLSNIRIILDSYSRLDNSSRLFNLPIGLARRLDTGYSACYSITEDRYKINENYKIGFVGNYYFGIPNENFYQSDLRSLMAKSKNQHAGFYEIVHTNSFVIGDITSVDVCKNSEKLFDIPFLIVGESSTHFYIKPIIETFEKPKKKSLMDIITRNQYWDCGRIEKEELTQKYIKLDINTVMPDRHMDVVETA